MKRALAIVDFQPAARGGHFREWSGIITHAASRHVDCVCVYVAGFDSIPTETTEVACDPKANCDVIFFDIDTVIPHYIKNASNASMLDYIVAHSVECSGCDNVAAFVLWSFDLSMQKRHPSAPWGGIGVLSAWARNIQSNSIQFESDLYQFVCNDRHCRALLVWDQFVLDLQPTSSFKVVQEGGSSKIHYLPDIEDVVIAGGDYLPRTDTLQIGLVGILWGYRGINLLAAILERNPDIDGYIAGELKPEGYTVLARDLLAKGRISLGQTEGRMTNSAFNQEICQLDALVIDAVSYPPPSGVALRALANGRCIIASEGPSWTNDIIMRYKCGLILDPSCSGGLSERIRSFYETGGSERCREAASDLMSQEQFEKCLGHALDALFD